MGGEGAGGGQQARGVAVEAEDFAQQQVLGGAQEIGALGEEAAEAAAAARKRSAIAAASCSAAR